MDQVIQVKSELPPNEEILLYYVDENGMPVEGNISIQQAQMYINEHNQEGVEYGEEEQNHQEQNQELLEVIQEEAQEEAQEECKEETFALENHDDELTERWSEIEVRRLLIFYIDNRDTFLGGVTKKKFLWSIACKTMLPQKNATSCDLKLRNVRRKYMLTLLDRKKGLNKPWSLFELAHQAFHDDQNVKLVLEQQLEQPTIPGMIQMKDEGVVVIKTLMTSNVVEQKQPQTEDKVQKMLELYYHHKAQRASNVNWQKGLWETIAAQLGNEVPEYWHKRFMNFKQHYIRMYDKPRETLTWPYMSMFDLIFNDDPEFQRKFVNTNTDEPVTVIHRGDNSDFVVTNDDWNGTEKMVLTKYYYDSLDEFLDPTIPNNFLWNEVGRLLNRDPEICKIKYRNLKSDHIESFNSQAEYLKTRLPLAILFDNIISRETEVLLKKAPKTSLKSETWDTETIDELVKFFYNNLDVFKDSICHYVCWYIVSKQLKRGLNSCRRQWEQLIGLYKSILEEKKENHDLQIDWRYIELFDKIFDYGMDTLLLNGYDKADKEDDNEREKKNIKQERLDDSATEKDANNTDDEDYNPKGYKTRTKKGSGDEKAFKILEFYLKNKEKFESPQQKKRSLWGTLAKQINLTPDECAHRFRNFKQVYTSYVQREINKPEMPVVWPYYQLCKKVFGYRAIRSKLKTAKMESDIEDWSAEEINQLLTYFCQTFNSLSSHVADTSKWTALASNMGKSENSCRDKFLELRKSYRKIKTMQMKNPNAKIPWTYYDVFENMFNSSNGEAQDSNGMEVEETVIDGEAKMDDDFQCILVIPEGQDLNDLSNAKIITPEDFEKMKNQTAKKWTKRSKKRLLILYITYVHGHREQEISAKEMWKEIATKLNKTQMSCRKMFAKLKRNRLNVTGDEVKKQSPYYALLEKVIKLRPKFKKGSLESGITQEKTYKDVPMASDKVQNALILYLDNLEEFANPLYDRRYVWTNLAKAVEEPVNKVLHKVNYLKRSFEQTDTESREQLPFYETLKQISEKEAMLKDLSQEVIVPTPEDQNGVVWKDDEIEQLLVWYLANLDKFKNPKFVKKYLWIEATNIMNKSAVACSKKMIEIRTLYRNMVRDNVSDLNSWRFLELCQKIYGTGKPSSVPISQL